MSSWTHAICDGCWIDQHPEAPSPKRVVDLTQHEPPPGVPLVLLTDVCCWCGRPTDGIYVRFDPAALGCGHQ